MKRILIIASIIIFIIFMTIFFSSNKTQLVDVRTEQEYKSGHLSGAINVPLADIQKGDLSKIDKNASVKLYCRSGRRASEAKLILERSGYNNVMNIGGLSELQAKGSTVCTSNKPSC